MALIRRFGRAVPRVSGSAPSVARMGAARPSQRPALIWPRFGSYARGATRAGGAPASRLLQTSTLSKPHRPPHSLSYLSVVRQPRAPCSLGSFQVGVGVRLPVWWIGFTRTDGLRAIYSTTG